ncbi:hypothetical protein EVJ24_00750 [Exiguobacterium sp. SH1S21]|uniref:hypothetical protein n=1 Tax=Exiguobacterium sp. SH1S21 TaxID=2510953 RepID=UPI00103AAD61|nr:hypothetical protein [Exiguobacterium sp. SH1S21]TCI57338.1 hypothetical protein EVJ24_00750 [Exiguobacterium sp. SH1S21]
MKQLLWALLVALFLPIVFTPASVEAGEPIPSHFRISNSPYVITMDGKELYHVGTGERIPLSKELDLHWSYQKNAVMSVDGQHLVFTSGCTDCSTTRYIIDLNGQVTSKSVPDTYRIVGADVAHDRLLWATWTTVMMTNLQGDIMWERSDLGTAVTLSTDGQTVIAARHDLSDIAHVNVATGKTESIQSFDVKVQVRDKEALAFDGVIAYPYQGYVYLEASRRLLALPEWYGIQYAEEDGFLHWYSKGVYGVLNITSGEVETHSPIVYPKLYPGTLAFSDRTVPLSSYKQMPTQLELQVDKRANAEGDPFLYVGRPYPLSVVSMNLDGVTETIPFERLTANKSNEVSSPQVFSYVTDANYNLTYMGKTFSGTLFSYNVGKVSIRKFGLAGEIVGQTAPGARMTVRVHGGEGEPLQYSTTATATGEFRVGTERLTSGTTFTVTSLANGSAVYRQPFTVPVPNPEANTIEVIGDSVESGVVFKTVPNGKIDVFVKEQFHSWYDTLQADASGIARVTGTVDPLAKGVTVTYAPAGTEGVEKELVVFERTEPTFAFQVTPNAGDTTLSYSSTAKLITYKTYVNEVFVGDGRTITLPKALQDGDVIRVVAKTGDRSKTLEHRVAAVGPTILQVTDVAMTATHTVVSVRRDTRAVLQFFINGKLTTATPVSSTRFTVPAKPGDIVLVRLTRGGQKLDTRLALPQVTFSNIRLHDEQKTWVGMVLPNSRVTLQNGTKQVTSGKSSSTGRVVMSLAPQSLNAKITLISTRGVYRFVQTVNVKAGLTPIMKVAAPTSTMRTLTVNSNVDYGTVTVHRGTTLIATKTVTSKSTPVAIAAQKSGTRLTIKFTTPKGRTQTVYVTVR